MNVWIRRAVFLLLVLGVGKAISLDWQATIFIFLSTEFLVDQDRVTSGSTRLRGNTQHSNFTRSLVLRTVMLFVFTKMTMLLLMHSSLPHIQDVEKTILLIGCVALLYNRLSFFVKIGKFRRRISNHL